jgi:hypothetical protein
MPKATVYMKPYQAAHSKCTLTDAELALSACVAMTEEGFAAELQRERNIERNNARLHALKFG